MGGADSEAGGTGGIPSGTGGQIEIADPIDPDEAPTYFGAGTRLQLIVDVVDGGPTTFKQFFDTEFDQPCNFEEVGDAFYCVPDQRYQAWIKGYSDATCIERLVDAANECIVDVTASRQLGECASDMLVEELKRPSEDVVAYDFDEQGNCVPTGETIPVATARVGQPFDLERLVRGREKLVPINGQRLGLVVLEAEDGAFAALRVVDMELGIECNYGWEAGSCVPTSFAYARYFEGYVDDACQTEAAWAFAAAPEVCGEVNWVRFPIDGEPYFEFHRIGRQTSPERWRLVGALEDQECIPWEQPVTYRGGYVYEVGELPSTPLAEATETLHGDGRVKAIGISAGGTLLKFIGFRHYDTAREESCSSVSVGGVQLCVPLPERRSYDSIQFADSACTEKLQRCPSNNCGTHYYYELASYCQQRDLFAAIHQAVEEVTDPVYELDDDGNCEGPVDPENAWTSIEIPPEQSGLPFMEEAILP